MNVLYVIYQTRDSVSSQIKHQEESWKYDA